MKHFITLKDFNKQEITKLIKEGIKIKKYPKKYARAAKDKTLVMIFEAPSLRTRLSFEAGMTQMGGHGIFYTTGESTLGKKESLEDFTKVVARYGDVITARLYSHEMMEKMAEASSKPVINAMTNFEHPCQILSDLMTIQEKFKTHKNKKLAYVGDGDNNVANSLIFGCTIMGMDIAVACPGAADVQKDVKRMGELFSLKSKADFTITRDAKEAVKDADVVYTDTWMSYRIPKEEQEERERLFAPYQVNMKLMKMAKKNAVFMHCLPAHRGHEVTDEVMDSKRSVIFDQAENRMHCQKALILWLLKQGKK